MKALILAAGYATRLYPLTLNQPKPLLKVNGIPILEYIIKKLEQINIIDEIYVVCNNKFYNLFLDWSDNYGNKKIKIINDGSMSKEDRLGAIGDIDFVINKENIQDDLLIIGGDNLFENNLFDLIDFFKENGSVILLNDVEDKELAKLYGVVTTDSNNKIINFVEKPNEPESTLASTLIYVLKNEHLSSIKEVINKGLADRAGDFIKYLSVSKDVFGLPLAGQWFDIGSMEQLEQAEEYFRNCKLASLVQDM